jgi:GNAT superfamily N-acetyltransferase
VIEAPFSHWHIPPIDTMELEFSISDEADDNVRKQIVAPLVQYNDSQAGPGQHRPLVVTLRDAAGQVVGGLWGATGYGWLFTQLLVVPESARGKGVGTRLMHMAEQEAIGRGCQNAWLDTFEFQAKAFYERLGYVCFGELADYPSGFSRYFLRKTLAKVMTPKGGPRAE